MARLNRAFPVQRHFKKPPYFPPRFLKISGQVTISGTPQSGVTVYLIDETTATLIGVTTTDGSGNYIFTSANNLVSSHTYHVAVEYDSGATKYNARSLPYVSPVVTL